MDRQLRHRYWVIWVWIVVAFFLFPLTPPISQNVTFNENALSQFNETPAFIRVKSDTTKVTVPLLYPDTLKHIENDDPDPCFPLLFVLFALFLLSRLRELLKKHLLDPLKFTSAYVAPSPSVHL